jgi:TetR/AcrR family transcriptional regulator, ethionamide resistance regulator
MGRQPDAFDRRPPHRGDRRRAALLEAMDAFLREGDFESVTISDITARAGVTRPAFYFYFENKAACVAALGVEVYQDVVAAADHLFDAEVPPRERIDRMVEGLFAAWESREYLYRAALDARRASASLRELWAGYRESFVPPVATMIDDERAAGRAPAGPDSTTLARMLLDLGDRTLESLDPLDRPDIRSRADALAAIWLRSIYGTVHAEAPDAAVPAARKGRSRSRTTS